MPEASPDLNVRLRLAVKAGIGGFHPAVKQLAGKACNWVPLPNGAFHWEPCKKDSQIEGGSIPDRTQKRSINFPKETLEALDKLAAKKHTTASELVREYVDKGLSIEGSREDIDFIARLIRQEITAVYHVDEIKAIAD